MMPAYVTETVIWTCVAAFVVCMIAGLLVVTGVWEPKDPAIRKWLLRAVVFSAVGAVASFAVQQFSKGGGNPPPTPELNESGGVDRVTPGGVTDTAEPPRRRDPTPAPVERPQHEPVRSVPAVPEEIAPWAESELGARPVFVSPTTYPDCVGKLRQQDTVSRKEARNCRAELEQLHLTAIVGFYNLKRPYDSLLEQHEEALREHGITQAELTQYNYVVAEMERLNGDGSEETAALHDLEERLLLDMKSCRISLCQSPD